MNAFFRSALFPLIVIVLLVYLAGQTILADDRPPTTQMTYAEAQRLLRDEPQRIDEITLRPNERKAVVRLVDGTNAKTPASGSSDWWWYAPLGAFLLVAVFIQLLNRSRRRAEEDLTAHVRNRSTA